MDASCSRLPWALDVEVEVSASSTWLDGDMARILRIESESLAPLLDMEVRLRLVAPATTVLGLPRFIPPARLLHKMAENTHRYTVHLNDNSGPQTTLHN